MQPLDADGNALAIRLDDNFTLADDRRLILADLVALRQVLIEIILTVEGGAPVYLRLQAKAGAHRLAYAFFVDDRQHARHRRIDQRDMGVRLAAELGLGAREQL